MKNVTKIGGILGGIVLAAWLTAGSAMADNLVLVNDVQGEGMLYVSAAEAQATHVKEVKKIDCPCLENMLSEGLPENVAPAATMAVQQNSIVAMADSGLGDVY